MQMDGQIICLAFNTERYEASQHCNYGSVPPLAGALQRCHSVTVCNTQACYRQAYRLMKGNPVTHGPDKLYMHVMSGVVAVCSSLKFLQEGADNALECASVD